MDKWQGFLLGVKYDKPQIYHDVCYQNNLRLSITRMDSRVMPKRVSIMNGFSAARSFHRMTGDADLTGSSPRAGEGSESVCQCQRQGVMNHRGGRGKG